MHLTTDINLGTPRQQEKGIMGHAKVSVWNEQKNQRIFEIRDVTIMRRRSDGQLFVSMPNKPFQTPEGENRRFYYVFVGPDEGRDTQGGIRDKFNNMILQKFDEKMRAEGQTMPPNQPASPPQNQQAPAWGNDNSIPF